MIMVESINMNRIHEDLRELKREIIEMKMVIEEDFELSDDVLDEISASRKREDKEFISHEDMKKEFE